MTRTLLQGFSIQIKLLVSFLLVAFVIAAISTAVFINENSKISYQQLLEVSSAQVSSLTHNFVKVLMLEDVNAEIDATATLRELHYISAMQVINKNNAIVFQYFDQKKFQSFDGSALKGWQDPEQYNHKNEHYILFLQDIAFQDQSFGTVVTLIDKSGLEYRLAQNVEIIYWLVPLLIIVAIILAHWLQHYFSKPILELTQQVEVITKDNDFSRLTSTPEDNEIKHLSLGINAMLKEVTKQSKTLHEYKYAMDVSAIVSIADRAGNIIYSNQKFSDISKYTAKELLGQNHRMLKTEEHDDDFFFQMWDQISSGNIWHGEVKNRAKNGGFYWVNTHIIPILDDHLVPEKYLSIRFEITDQKIAEAALHDLNESLEQRISDRTKEVFESQKKLMEVEKLASLGSLVAGVAHEVNTPLGVSVTAASFIVEEINELCKAESNGTITREGLHETSEHLLEGANMILNNLTRASELVKSFKQISADLNVNEYRVINVDEYLHEIFQSLKPQFKNTNIAININVQREIDIYINPGYFAQIITNFITNSLKYAFDKAQQGEITVNAKKLEDGSIEIEYLDDGKGMSAEVMEKVFEPFFTTGRNEGSTGLGMHIVHNLINKMEGSIHCESEPNQGVMFSINIPNLNPDS